MKAYLVRDDLLFCFVGLSPKPPEDSNVSYNDWLKNSTKSKSNITLSLGDSAMSRTRLVVDDDDASAKGLCEELDRFYTTTNAQAIRT